MQAEARRKVSGTRSPMEILPPRALQSATSAGGALPDPRSTGTWAHGRLYRLSRTASVHVIGVRPGLVMPVARPEQRPRSSRTLDGLSSLQDGWNGYDAPAPNAFAIQNAHAVLGQLHRRGIPVERVLASAEGGVGIVLSRGDWYVDIECFNDGAAVLTMSHRDGRIVVEESEPQDIDGLLDIASANV